MRRKLFVWPVIFTLVLFFNGLLAQTASGGTSMSFAGYGWDCATLASVQTKPPAPPGFWTGESFVEYELNLQFKGKNVTGTLEWISYWYDEGLHETERHEAVLENGKFENGWLSFVVSYQDESGNETCPYDYSRDQFNLVWIDNGDGTVTLQGGAVSFANFDCVGFWDTSELGAVELYSSE
jgi:hypothetical protein